MNAGDLAHLVIRRGRFGRPVVAAGEDEEAAIFYVKSTDGQCAVIRWADDEVELTVPVADLIPVNSLS